jgi:2-C-methyl-D-erythritol 4-phosphate cytidylyltransferase
MTSAIIVAAGKSARMGPQKDKLFLPVVGRPLVAHTWERFDRAGCIDQIVIVVREGMESAYAELAAEFGFRKPFQIVIGGKERQESVWNGLQRLCAGTEIVAIQDAARPCTSEALIQATITAARQEGAAVAAQPVSDTIKESADGEFICGHLDRSLLWAVQTPQTFRTDVILRALAKAREKGVVATDDTAACELIGQPVKLVTGFGPNPKLTFPHEVPYVELLLRGQY